MRITSLQAALCVIVMAAASGCQSGPSWPRWDWWRTAKSDAPNTSQLAQSAQPELPSATATPTQQLASNATMPGAVSGGSASSAPQFATNAPTTSSPAASGGYGSTGYGTTGYAATQTGAQLDATAPATGYEAPAARYADASMAAGVQAQVGPYSQQGYSQPPAASAASPQYTASATDPRYSATAGAYPNSAPAGYGSTEPASPGVSSDRYSTPTTGYGSTATTPNTGVYIDPYSASGAATMNSGPPIGSAPGAQYASPAASYPSPSGATYQGTGAGASVPALNYPSTGAAPTSFDQPTSYRPAGTSDFAPQTSAPLGMNGYSTPAATASGVSSAGFASPSQTPPATPQVYNPVGSLQTASPAVTYLQ